MATFLLLILCLNIDALSFGVTYGLRKIKFNFLFSLKLCIISTFLFTIPLILSPLVFEHLNKQICNIINGIVLILLSLMYFFKKSSNKQTEIQSFSTKKFLLECLAFSVDAIFTAFLGGFPSKKILFFIIFYFFSNFFAIYFGNFFVYKFGSKIKINLDFLGGIIFFTLGLLKIFGI